MNKSKVTRSTGSPGRHRTKDTMVNQLRESEANTGSRRESVCPSPLNKTVLSDNTDIMEPRRESWWKKVDKSCEISEVLEEKPVETNNIVEEFDVEILSQEKKLNYTLDLPESSGSESIGSIVLPQRKLFTQKENHPQKQFNKVVDTRDSLAKLDKQNIEDDPSTVGRKTLFGHGAKRSKPIFPSALLNLSHDKTIGDKTKELVTEVAPQRNLFGHRAGTKRKNMFADFILTESDDEIPEIKVRRFTFPKQPEPVSRKSSVSRPNSSPASSITTDIELDDWKGLPSSTMMEHQLEDANTPFRRARLSKLMETKETINTNSTGDKSKQSVNSGGSKDKSNTSVTAMEAENDSKVTQSLSPPKNANSSLIHTRNASHVESLQHETTGNKDVGNNIDNLTHTINKTNKMDEITDKQEASPYKIDNLTRTLNRSSTKQLSETKPNETANKTETDQFDNLTRTLNKSSTKQLSEAKLTETANKIETEKINNLTRTLNTTKQHSISNVEDNLEIQLASIVGQENQMEDIQAHENDGNITLTYDEDEDDQDQNKADETLVPQETNDTEKKSAQKEKTLVLETPMPRKSKSVIISKVVNETPEEIPEENEQQDDIQEFEQDEDAVFKPSQELERSTNIKMIVENEIDMKDQETDKNAEVKCNTDHDKVENNDKIIDVEAVVENRNEVENQTPADNIEMEIDQQIENQNDPENQNKEAEEKMAEEERESDDEEDELVDQHDHDVNEAAESENYIESENNEDIPTEDADIFNEDDNRGTELEAEAEEGLEDENESDEQEESREREEEDQNREDLEESQEVEDRDQEVEESLVMEDEDQVQDEVVEESQEIDEDQNPEEMEESQELEETEDNEKQNETQEVEPSEDQATENSEQENSDAERTPDVSHDTTGRHRNKDQTRTPEAALLNRTNPMDSFTGATGRNTSIRKTILKRFSIQPSIAPLRESMGITDSSKNSSAEGSGWDSHRNERKTLRLTFGKDFTPRKSLRAMVMEKSAKRKTIIDEANADLRLHQANSTEMPIRDQDPELPMDDHHDETSGHDFDDAEPSVPEISMRTKQATLEQYLEKIKKEGIQRRRQIDEEVRQSVMSRSYKYDVLNARVPTLSTRKPLKTLQSAPKAQKTKRTKVPLEELPPQFVEDMKYKPPKRFRPSNASWITKRLYKFLESKLEPRYDYKARVRAEKLVETIYTFARELRRQRVASPHAVTELKREMARLEIVKTHFEFYNFFNEYMPNEIRFKVVPDIVNDIPTPRNGVFSDILD